MRGLDEIHETNENPGQRRDEHFGARAHEGDKTSYRSFETNLADKKRREASSGHKSRTDAILEGILQDIVGGRPKTAVHKTVEAIGEMLAVATVYNVLGIEADADYDKARDELPALLRKTALNGDLQAIRGRAHASLSGIAADIQKTSREHLGMEGIDAAIDAKPPFLAFWKSLNDNREAHGLPEAGYGEAKKIYSGGDTPEGALTFVGKDWDGLRAVAANSTDGKKTYHGEFRQTVERGAQVWRVVHNDHGPIAYASPEAALNGARHAKLHSERQS